MDFTSGSASGYTGGYVCSNCKGWVVNGTYHACIQSPVQFPQYVYVYPQTPSSPQYDDILAELRSIRRLLESK